MNYFHNKKCDTANVPYRIFYFIFYKYLQICINPVPFGTKLVQKYIFISVQNLQTRIKPTFYLSMLFIVGSVNMSAKISIYSTIKPYFTTSLHFPIFQQISINHYICRKIGSELVQKWFREPTLTKLTLTLLLLPAFQFPLSEVLYPLQSFHKIILPSE